VLLLKLSHCTIIICSFQCAYLFICLRLHLTLFPLSTSPFLVFKIHNIFFLIFKLYVSIMKCLKTLFLLKLSQLSLQGVLHSSSSVVHLLYHLILICVFRCPLMWLSSLCCFFLHFFSRKIKQHWDDNHSFEEYESEREMFCHFEEDGYQALPKPTHKLKISRSVVLLVLPRFKLVTSLS
jgi:hypothetical protein